MSKIPGDECSWPRSNRKSGGILDKKVSPDRRLVPSGSIETNDIM
jgi:hypothetical protein